MKGGSGEHPFGDAGQLILLALFLLVWALDSFHLRVPTFLSGMVPGFARLALVAAAEVCALALLWEGHRLVEGEERPAKVLSSGAFRYVRHPLYLGCLLFYVGLAISTLSLLSILAFAGIFAFYDFIASYEERLLEARFGSEYATYKSKTGKWFPRVGRTKG
jgi:protein-S-isoprenylcysteine O-methyltransferase Ste14